MSYIFPLSAAFAPGQLFGTNPGGVNPAGGHTGMDYPAPVGTILRAPADGVIEFAQKFTTSTGADNPYWLTGGGGNIIVLNAGAGAPSFIMAHLSEMHVTQGQRVKQGDIIGKTGNSGWWTTGPHLHFEVLADGFNLQTSTYGRSNPTNFCTGYWESNVTVPLSADQRRNGDYVVKQRSAPRLNADVVREIQPNSIEVFKGFVRGDMVDLTADGGYKSDLWYVDQHGYCSVTLFEPFTVAGLPDLTPKAVEDSVAPNQRVTAADGAQGRKTPDKNGDAVSDRFLPDKILTFKGFVRADVAPYPNTTNIWFVSISGWYFWAGSFVDEGTHDLPDLTPSVVPSPSTPIPPAPKAYDFPADFTTIAGIIVEKLPAHSSNVEVGNFPAAPSTLVKHHWGAGYSIPFTSPVGEFQRKESYKSAHMIVGETRIAQMVKIGAKGEKGDRAYHAGKGGNDFIGIECDPCVHERDSSGAYTPKALRIQANVQAVHAAIELLKGYKFEHMLHKQVPGNATECAPMDLATLLPRVAPPVVAPAPVTPPPVVVPVPVPTVPVVPAQPLDERAVLLAFATWQVDQYLSRKK